MFIPVAPDRSMITPTMASDFVRVTSPADSDRTPTGPLGNGALNALWSMSRTSVCCAVV